MYTIDEIGPADAERALPQLAELLRDSVDGGASVGFLPPLSAGEAQAYWADVAQAMRGGSRVLLVARGAAGVAGSVQLDLALRANGAHRAEVQKLLVHSAARRRGLGRALMEAAEVAARARGRSLLVLDTRQGDAAEQLYAAIGYARAGVIPRYARGADGALHATVLFYKLLELE